MSDEKKVIELSEDDLKLLTGGKLNDEAWAWVARNFSAILRKCSSRSVDYIGSIVEFFSPDSIKTLDEVKEFLKGLEVDIADLK